MNVEFAKIDDVNGQLTITIDENDYSEKVKKELKNIAKNHAEPGFRPGKTPSGLIAKKYGDAAKYEVINRLIGDTLFDYIKGNKLHVLGNPVPDESNSIDVPAKEFTFKFKLGLAPDINLNLDKEFHLPYYKIRVSDDMLEKQDAHLRRRFGTQAEGEEVEETSVVRGTITELDENGQPLEGGISVENGILSPEHFKDADQKALFIGKKKDDEIIFSPAKASGDNAVEMGSMLQIGKEDALNHKGDFKFKVTDIISLKPAEEGQDFYDTLFGKDQVHNHEEYEAALRKMIEAQLTRDQDFRFTIDAKDGLIKAVGEVNLPDEVLKQFLLSREGTNITAENIEEAYPELRPDMVWELIREYAAEKLAVKLEKEDVEKLAAMVAIQQYAQYGMMNPSEEMVKNLVEQIFKDKEASQRLASQAYDIKFYDALRNAVSLDEKDVDVEEFNKLFTENA